MVKRILSAGLVVSALLITQSAQAQSYFYGYYYPDGNYFRTDRVVKTGYESYGVPMFLEGRTAPTYGQMQPRTTYVPATTMVPPAAAPANVSVLLPSADAKVWFANHLTTSTGTARNYVTPPLTDGASFSYHLTARWTHAGQEVAVERDVSVVAGQTVVVDFTRK